MFQRVIFYRTNMDLLALLRLKVTEYGNSQH